MTQVSNVPATQQRTTAPAMITSVNFFDPVQFDTVQRMSKLFASSKLVPAMYQIGGIVKKGKDGVPVAKDEAIANCMIALDVATRIGASPLMVMQNLAIIEGRPSWSSKFLIATVNSCGRFEPLKFKLTNLGMLGKFNITEFVWDGGYKKAVTREFDGTKIPNLQCVAYTTKKGSDEVLESSPITLRMAIEEGWYTKNGSKWRTMPEQMLRYRAASFWTNAYAPELSMGMRTTEEVQDFVDITDTAVDVTEEVREEKKDNANKTTISFDAPQEEAPTTKVPDGVDPETGEVLQPQQEQKTQAAPAPQAPTQAAPAAPKAPAGPAY
jgi:hypothetical protein